MTGASLVNDFWFMTSIWVCCNTTLFLAMGIPVWLLRRYPVVRIVEARPGQRVALEGWLSGDEQPAPLSGKPCAAWSVRVAHGSRKTLLTTSSHWSTLPLTLHDGTGQARIVLTGARMRVQAEEVTGLLQGDAGPQVRQTLAAMGATPPSFNTHLFEYRLAEGQRVTAYGVLEEHDGTYLLRATPHALILSDKEARRLQRDARRSTIIALAVVHGLYLLVWAGFALR